MLYHIPIEPYETRYTADWIQQFEHEFEANNVEFTTILGNAVSSTVSTGGVLDTAGTHIYKFSQLTKLMELFKENKIKDNDVIFFADLWFPGLESLFYVRNMTGIKFKVVGILHAGTYDTADFTYRNGMRRWGRYLEASWLDGIDNIFVATRFHKQLIIKNSLIDITTNKDKIVVTGIPFYGNELKEKYLANKENILVFPHRLDQEKHPEMFDKLVEWLREQHVDFTPIKTIVETKSREEYFKVLGKSKVMISFADQETFGYSTVESMALDNVVVVPDKLSYVETVPEECRYHSTYQAFDMVKKALENYSTPNYDVSKWRDAVSNMLPYIVKE